MWIAASTRRSLLARAAQLTGVSLLGRSGVAGAAGPPAERVFSLWVGDLPAGDRLSAPRSHASAAMVTGPVLPAGEPFDLVGLEWDGPASAGLQLRVGRAGAWSRWVPAGDHGHSPDGPKARRTVGDPIWAGGAQQLQLRAPGSVRGVRVHFVRVARPRAIGPTPGASAASSRARAAAAGAADTYAAGPGQPAIIRRQAWGAGLRPRRRAGIGEVRLAFVHHTENANSYSSAEAAAMVRAIFFFHRDVKGWNDIGYNFLVDRFGRIFEGREGGISEAVVGAQAGGYNLVSTGVGTLGDFRSTAPSAAGLAALAELLAWKLTLHGVPARGRVGVRVNPAGASFSRFPAGSHVRLNRISGHRDGDSTDCPGDRLYRRLPGLRRRVAERAGTVSRLQLSVLAPLAPASPAGAGATIALAGRLQTLGGAPIAGAPIEIQARVGIHRVVVGHAVTGADGRLSASVPGGAEQLLRAAYRGDASHSAVVSPDVQAGGAATVTLQSSAASVAVGATAQLSGGVSPAGAPVTLEIYHQPTGGPLAHVRTLRPPTDGGSFSAELVLDRVGLYRVVAHIRRTRRHGAAASAPLEIQARSP